MAKQVVIIRKRIIRHKTKKPIGAFVKHVTKGQVVENLDIDDYIAKNFDNKQSIKIVRKRK